MSNSTVTREAAAKRVLLRFISKIKFDNFFSYEEKVNKVLKSFNTKFECDVKECYFEVNNTPIRSFVHPHSGISKIQIDHYECGGVKVSLPMKWVNNFTPSDYNPYKGDILKHMKGTC